MIATEYLQNWLARHVDGNWERNAGIRISTIPAGEWRVEIDLVGTAAAGWPYPYELKENAAGGWYSFEVEDVRFVGLGDPTKLDTLLEIFRTIVQNHEDCIEQLEQAEVDSYGASE